MKAIYNAALCALVLLSSACRQEPAPAQRAFYHWKTRLSLSAEERAFMDRLRADKLYVKFFDVDWSEPYAGPVPMAEVEIDTALLGGLDIVPCIFLTNRCMTQLPGEDVPELAGRMLKKTEELAAQYPGLKIKELQLDCDWTASTRERYFALLGRLRAELAPKGIALSATVRLHQYRWPEQTGVPPVDRGMLMCYNTGDLESWEEENSILRAEEAGKYVAGAEPYPLPLDAALPAFGWGVLFRNDRMIRLIHALAPGDLADTLRFRQTQRNRFEVRKSTYLDGHYLYEGDRLRIEQPSIADLEQSARMLKEVSPPGSTAAFYHLDSIAMLRFPEEVLGKVWGEWR